MATTACPTIARAARSWFDGFAQRYTLFPALRHTIAGRPHLTLTGTSMAAGVVSGSVALMIEEAKATFGAAPPVSAMKAMLQVSAFPMKSSGSVADQLDTIDPGNIQLSDNPLIASGVCSKGRD